MTHRLLQTVLSVALAVALGSCGRNAPGHSPGYDVARTLSGPVQEGFAQATEPRPFVFPDDHGPHPAFRSEWWYLVGNLEAADGRAFGYQFTIFRTSLLPPRSDRPARGSAWASDQFFMGHLALSELDGGGRYHSQERFARSALDLAGARAEPFALWLEDWQLLGPEAGGSTFPLQLLANGHEGEESFGIDLRIQRGKDFVPQGDRGLSQKSSALGNASHYYSATRMPTTGVVRVGDRSVSVAGDSWMDREWSTSALGEGQLGWDWFALQLDDGSDLMLYNMRRRDGSLDPHSSGMHVPAGGDANPRRLQAADFTLEPLTRWTSPASGVEYPVAWRVRVPELGLELEVSARQADQEHRHTFRYWEGAVAIRGTREDRTIGGRGYLEMTGY